MVDNLMDELCKTITRRYDDLIFDKLEPYMIDRYNLKENGGRITIMQDYMSDHYFVDGVYAFTIYRSYVGLEDDGYIISVIVNSLIDQNLVGMTVTDCTMSRDKHTL